MRGRVVAASAAVALTLLSACALRARDDEETEAEIARALAAMARVEASPAPMPSAIGPAMLTVVQRATPLRGANGLACFEHHAVVAEARADRILQLAADGRTAPLAAPAGLRGPADAVFDEQGTLFVAAGTSGEVWRRSPDASWSTVARGLPGLSAITRDRGGRLFVAVCAPRDGLYEIDPSGTAAPRKIAHDIGCPHAIVADDDGSLVVPLLSAGRVVRVRIADGGTTVLADGLHAPSAVARGPGGGLVVLEAATGTIRALAESGAGAELARLSPGIGGFTTCGDSALVSNFVTGAVVAFKAWPGSARPLEPPGLVRPHGLAMTGEDLLVSDGVSIRRLGEGRSQVLVATGIDPVPPPYAIALAPSGFVWVTVPELGEVYRIDLAARASTRVIGGLDWPTSIVVSPHGGAFVVDTDAGRVLEIDLDGTTHVLATGLLSPIGLALRGPDLVTLERDGGRVIALREGAPPTLVASGLASPVGLAVDPAGHLFVAEERTGSIVRIGADGAPTRIADGFDFHQPASHPAPIPLVAAQNGDVIVAQTTDGAIYRIAP